MTSSAGTRRWLVLAVVVVSMLVIWLSGVSEANNDESPVVDRKGVLTSPLFDVGRLWLRATVQQARRFADFLPLTTTVAKLVVAVVGLLVFFRLYSFFFLPIDRVKLLGDVGYMSDGRQSMKDVAEQVRRRRAVGDVPPVYPNGWFALIESRCLSVGDVKNVFCLGKISHDVI